eukprot:749552-Hanusia_phi.AAC.1
MKTRIKFHRAMKLKKFGTVKGRRCRKYGVRRGSGGKSRVDSRKIGGWRQSRTIKEHHVVVTTANQDLNGQDDWGLMEEGSKHSPSAMARAKGVIATREGFGFPSGRHSLLEETASREDLSPSKRYTTADRESKMGWSCVIEVQLGTKDSRKC